MAKPSTEELAKFKSTLDLIRKQYAEDGTIGSDDQARLDVLEGKIKRFQSAPASPGAGDGNELAAAPVDTDGNGPMPGLEGMDTGQVQALSAGDLLKIPGVKQVPGKAYKWATKSRKVTVIIKNTSDKDLRNVDKKAWGKAKWSGNGVPGVIAKGSEATIVIESEWGAIGRAPGSDAGGGYLIYEVVGDDRQPATRFKTTWPPRSVKSASHSTFETIIPPAHRDRYQILGHDRGNDTFVFTISSNKPADKPKDPKPKEPESGGGKDSKSAPPAPIDVLFEYNDFQLTSKARSQLHDFAVAYRAAKSTAKIKVEGWASIDGKEATNEKLSYNRAEAVFKYLVDKDQGGLSKDSVKWDGKGVTSDFDPDKKKLEPNRRVTIKLK